MPNPNPMPMDSGFKLTLDKIRVCSPPAYLSKREVGTMRGDYKLNIRRWEDDACQRLAMELETYIMGLPKEKVSIHEQWPTTWWQAFKERWFPKWAKCKWPVQYKRIDVEQMIYLAVCPHLQCDENRTHLEFCALRAQKAVG